MDGQYRPGDIVLGNWILKDMLGEGSFGKVFKAEREDFGTVYTAAVKIITIPQNQAEIKSARAEGMNEESVVAYFRSFVEEIVREFALMSRLKGTANIVSYEDHTVLPHTNNLGWDIIIRMELLSPLLDYCTAHQLTRHDITKLGIDICRALELCQKFNIVHRDIKPENIFVSELGDYKLGDFGIARTVEKTTSGLSKKGTYTYMAPEIYRGDAYGSSVDIYSLGIVLYRLLNDNRAPFLPEYPAPITHSAREAALAKRISGALLPVPKNADGRLAEIVLKACAYDPKERFSSPMQMREELEVIQYSREEAPVIYPQGDETPQKSVDYILESAPPKKGHETGNSFQFQVQASQPPENQTVNSRSLETEKSHPSRDPGSDIPQEGTVGLFGGRKCTSCGFDIENNAIFCNKCGVKQEDTGTPLVIAASTPQSPDDPEKTESMFKDPAAGHETGNSFQFQAQASQPPENQPFNSRSREIEKSHPSRDPSVRKRKVIEAVLTAATAAVLFLVVFFAIGGMDIITLFSVICVILVPAIILSKKRKNAGIIISAVAAVVCSVIAAILISSIPQGDSNTPPPAPASSPPAVSVSPEPGDTPAAGSEKNTGGTAVATGRNTYGQCNISEWQDIVAISAGSAHTVGVKADGTVIAVGTNNWGECDVSDWRDIVAISVGADHTVGLKTDGSVVSTGSNIHGQLPGYGWQGVIAVAAGNWHTSALFSDGTVVSVGRISSGAGPANSSWSDIISIAAGDGFTVGLKSNGTVVVTNNDHDLDVSGWRDIVAIDAGRYHIVGLRSDGTAVVAGSRYDVSDWRDIVAVAAGGGHTVGLKSDGTVVAVGSDGEGQNDVSGWRDIIAISAGNGHTVGIVSEGGQRPVRPVNPPSADIPEPPPEAEIEPEQEINQTGILGIWRTEWRESGSDIYMDVTFSESGDLFLQMGHDGVVQIEVEGFYVIEDDKIFFRGYDNIYSEYVFYTFTYSFSGNKLIFGWEGDIQREFTARR